MIPATLPGRQPPLRTRGFLKQFSDTLDNLLRALDALLVALAGLLAYLIYPGDWPLPAEYQLALLLAALLTPLIFPAMKVYRSWRGGGLTEEAGRIAGALLLVLLSLAFVAFAAKSSEQFSRIWLFSWASVGWLLLVGFRILMRQLLRVMRSHNFNTKRVLVVGAGEQGLKVQQRLSKEAWTGLQVIGFLDDSVTESAAELPPILGRIDDIDTVCTRTQVDEIWIALPLRHEQRVRDILAQLRHSTVSIRYVPDLFSFQLLNSAMTEVGGMPVFDICTTPMHGINIALKYLEDRVLAGLILVLVSPLMLLIAIGVKLSSPGPVLFKQWRHGWGGKPIQVYKFRTMVQHQESGNGVTQASRDDPRVTPLGRFLRCSSLDELPQFINVLQGRMSIVGPRPHALEHNEHYKEVVDSYMLRHKVKPGITGWAQINGWRGETDSVGKMEKRVEFDLFYIEHWSLWFDLRIILLTVFRGFGNRNAY